MSFFNAAHLPRKTRFTPDLFSVEWIDTREGYGEERVILLGTSQGQILAVVYTEREERIRIISARRATKDEQDRYFRENGR